MQCVFEPGPRTLFWSRTIFYAYLSSSDSWWCCLYVRPKLKQYQPKSSRTICGKCKESTPLLCSRGFSLSSDSNGCASAHDIAFRFDHQDERQSRSIFKRLFLVQAVTPFYLPPQSMGLLRDMDSKPSTSDEDTRHQCVLVSPRQFSSNFSDYSLQQHLLE